MTPHVRSLWSLALFISVAGICGAALDSAHAAGLSACEAQRARLHIVPPLATDLSGLSGLRQSILSAARGELGLVEAAPDADGQKTGWRRIAEYFRLAWPGLKIDSPLSPYTGLTLTDRLKPVNGKIAEWCGLFALWAVKTGASSSAHVVTPDRAPLVSCADGAGRAPQDFRGLYLPWVEWRNGHIDGLPYHVLPEGKGRETALTRVQPGDIVVFKGRTHHHGVVEAVSHGAVSVIAGNTYCQMVSRSTTDSDSIEGYYSVE